MQLAELIHIYIYIYGPLIYPVVAIFLGSIRIHAVLSWFPILNRVPECIACRTPKAVPTVLEQAW